MPINPAKKSRPTALIMQNRFRFHPPLRLKPFLLLLACLFSPASWSETDPQVSDFALLIERTDSDWSYPSRVQQTTTSRLLAVWHESFGPTFKGGLRLAYLELSQASNPFPSAQTSTGYSLGFDIHARLLNARLLQLGLIFAYDYQSTSGSSPDQTSDFVWYTGQAGLDAILAPLATVSALAGISLTVIDGEQRLSGDLNRIIPFNQENSLGYYAGISLKTDATGSIGLKWHGGTKQGVEFVFRREF